MATVSWTDEAQLWLRDIHDYIAADNPAAAERVVLAIHACVQMLREVRRLLYGHYRIAYLIDADSGNIDVLGVFHGALPIERYLL
jgi:plasmid stabilization system protein ParE